MPDFSSHGYWEARFSKDSTPFDWLLPARRLCDIALDWTDEARVKGADVLHIGCGSSESSALRELVEEPSQVHNVDYSRAAIDAAMSREDELLEQEQQEVPAPDDLEMTKNKHDSVQYRESSRKMRWSCLDLLSLDATLTLLDQQAEAGRLFDLVLDKSTSDSVASGSGVPLQLPYPLSINGWTRGIASSGVSHLAEIHPLHVLAVHLAVLTTPKEGRWIAISYSDARFPFFPPMPHSAEQGFLPDSVLKAGFPHPSQLWTLEAKEKIDTRGNWDETLAERKKRLQSGQMRRPQPSHWLYVLKRTEVMVTD
ncbi:hypothetical protein LTR37_018573 [Vermiconidia calcicola]|uniref:Uncharacterized protein n=1 Tax=Vermiconidia calcicola TaxID=1690605 RepID=A0ACC3MGK2_9PEZI|nr:hypothetical protein LTR37_018573 [Vermiconidia calcicola]